MEMFREQLMGPMMTRILLSFSTAAMFGLGLASTNAADLDQFAPEEVEKLHHVEVFLGNTHTEEGVDAFSIGGEYEYRMNPLLGIGVLGEYAFEDVDSWVFGVPLTIHPGAGWQLVAMPGVELEGDETTFLFRVGVGYEFELEQFTIKPEFNADFVDDEVDLVFGASLGFGF